jgi:hypothetical protein
MLSENGGHLVSNWDWLAGLQGPVDEDFRLAAEEQVPAQERDHCWTLSPAVLDESAPE